MQVRATSQKWVHTLSHYIICIPVFLLICIQPVGAASKTWTGAAGDGRWNNPGNWFGNSLPGPADDVVLDHSVLGSTYMVSLPDTAVTVKTLTIHPNENQNIYLILPASNLSEPGFTATGPGYALVIDNGGIFQNGSGLASGESLQITDSFRINNGGKYIHHTRASHANNIVRILSAAPGTERGIFEFDVPRASYTVSASNRIYGTLQMSANAAGGSITYTCSGSNPLLIRGHLQMEEGVHFNADLAGPGGNITIKGDFIQDGGVFNLASGAGDSTLIRIAGNLIQSDSGLITESNTGLPSLELNGSSPQIISLAGTLSNSVRFRMNNPEGAILLAPLKLPYSLELIKGRITSSASNLLILSDQCRVLADSSSTNSSFVDGPLRKEGLTGEPFFLFPVGKGSQMRWLELKNARGNFVVEYKKNNPATLGGQPGTGIDHISGKEYWSVIADSLPAPSAALELSFLDPASGGVTNLATLTVAALSGTSWVDAGQAAFTGVAAANGSVVSLPVNLDQEKYFTLASLVPMENPLPLTRIDFRGSAGKDSIRFSWELNGWEGIGYFELYDSENDQDWNLVQTLPADEGRSAYGSVLPGNHRGLRYYRLRVIQKNGQDYLSQVITLNESGDQPLRAQMYPSIVRDRSVLEIHSTGRMRVQSILVSMEGKIIERKMYSLEQGSNIFQVDFSSYPPGIYQILLGSEKQRPIAMRWVKIR